MKNQFQNYVQQFQTNSMMKYIEKQRKMDEEQHEKQIEKLEKSFKIRKKLKKSKKIMIIMN